MATVHMIVHMSFEAWACTNPIHIAVHYAHGFIAIFASRVPAIVSSFSVMEEQSSILKGKSKKGKWYTAHLQGHSWLILTVRSIFSLAISCIDNKYYALY